MSHPQTSLYRTVALALLLSPHLAAQGAAPLFSGSTTFLTAEHQVQAVLDLDHDGDQDLLAWYWITEPGILPQATITGFDVDVEGFLHTSWSMLSPLSDSVNCDYAATAVGDFDGDGFDDFAIGLGRHVFVYLTRAGSPPLLLDDFVYPTGNVVVEGLDAGDMNGDGLDDLVLSNRFQMSLMLAGGAGAPFAVAGRISAIPFGNHHFTEMIDFDGDGSVEFMYRDNYPDVLHVLDFVNGQLDYFTYFQPTLPYTTSLTVGDIDGDGDEDIVLFNRQGANLGMYQVFRNQGPSNFLMEPLRPGGPATHLIDIDLDGDLDGLCCGGGSGCHYTNDQPAKFEISLNDGTGLFDHAVGAVSMETGFDGLAGVIDMDGDGDLDMIGGRSALTNHLMVGAPYCEPAVNSTGVVSRLSLSGSASMSRSDLTLHASGLPAGKVSIVLLGGRAAQTVVGNSLLCLESPIKRYAVTSSNSLGRITMGIPTASLPGAYPGAISPGATRRFQVWHRDNGLSQFGFSEGIRLTYAP